jgi:hypothetical protein
MTTPFPSLAKRLIEAFSHMITTIISSIMTPGEIIDFPCKWRKEKKTGLTK